MSLENWRDNKWLISQPPSPQDIADLLAISDRDLKDCQSSGLSVDWKFNIAYNALLQAASAALAAAGYRTSHGGSHHYYILQSLELTVGMAAESLRILDAFRKKRNLAGYERIGSVSEKEADELIKTAKTVRKQVERWIKAMHPELL